MTTPKLSHSYIGEGGELLSRNVRLDTENTVRLSERFPIKKISVRKYVLPNTLEHIEQEDLAARMLSHAKEEGRIVAVSQHDFLADMYDELNESFDVEKNQVFRAEHSLTTQLKRALGKLFLGRSLPPPPLEELESPVSALIAMARVNPSAIQGEVLNMIQAEYFNNIEVNDTEYLEPTEKLLERIFKVQQK